MNAIIEAHPELSQQETWEVRIKDRQYTWGELNQAFRSVCNQKNWKLPIDVEVSYGNDLSVITRIVDAIGFFTGDDQVTRTFLPGRKVRVESRGYYAIIGA